MILIRIDPYSRSPIYEQVIHRISELIMVGDLKNGDKLPSVRTLARDLGVNPNTVQRALSELERDGLVFSQRTAGRFVTENENMIANAKLRIADERVGEFLHSMKTLGCTRDEVIALIQGAKEEEE